MLFKGIEICCPFCKGDLQETRLGKELFCGNCDKRFPIILGIPDLRVFPDPYIAMEADREKGMKIASRFEDLTFRELVEYYYSITSVVPLHHAKQYTRGLMAGPERAAAALASWNEAIGKPNGPKSGWFLEVGCGTGPLLVSAKSYFGKMVGVDVAFRWLVVAKKRLAEAKLDVPLICACAEALPFRGGAFQGVVGESVLEHLRNQTQAMEEINRVVHPGGYLMVSAPNRFSAGPDPQTGIFAGGFLPERIVAAIVRRQGGIPPKRHLLTARSLSVLFEKAGFVRPTVLLPGVTPGLRDQFSKSIQWLIDLYVALKRVPLTRNIIFWISPFFHAVSKKPGVPS